MNQLPVFQGILKTITSEENDWKKLFDASEPHKVPCPGEFETKLDKFQKLIILKAIRSDKLQLAFDDFVVHSIGPKFTDFPTFEIGKPYSDSASSTPLIFVLSQGSDPVNDYLKFVEDRQMKAKSKMLSLG